MLRAALLLGSVCAALSIQSFWYNVHDGQDRLQAITEADLLGPALQAKPLVIVWVRQPVGDPAAHDHTLETVTSQMLQMTAQHFEKEGVFIASLALTPESTLSTDYGIAANDVLVLKGGRVVIYNGYRSADVFTQYLKQLRLGGAVLSVIDGKATKKEFDRVRTTKVVGFFVPNDPALADFTAAAAEYAPNVPFFVVHDAVVAMHLKMNSSGEIHIIKPFDKKRIPVPQVPATIDDIRIALYDNSRPVLSKLSMDNIHSLWENVNDNVHTIVSFSSKNTAGGPPFYKVLKNVIRTFINDTTLEVTVIEPEQFPMVVPHWEALYNISLSAPALGLVNLTDNNSTWFDIPAMQILINSTDKQAMMTQWFTDILQGVIRVDGLEPATPVIEEPVPLDETTAGAATDAATEAATDAVTGAATDAATGAATDGTTEPAAAEAPAVPATEEAKAKEEL